MKSNTKLLFLFVFPAALDQFAKYISSVSMCNKNLAWNIPISGEIFYFVWIVIIAFLIYLFSKNKSYYQKIFLILIFSGAASNLVDRIRVGCIIDYIDLKFFPAFNLADAYISIGILFLILNIIKTKDTGTRYLI